MTLCGLLARSPSSASPLSQLQRKVLVLGDGACGKTSLLFVLIRHHFPQEYEPTVFENYTHLMHSSRGEVELTLWDTAGQEEFDKLRSLSYADTDVVVLCFDVGNPVSLQNVESRVSITPFRLTCSHTDTDAATVLLARNWRVPQQWIPEIREHTPTAPIALLALKCDLRDSVEKPTLGYTAGIEMAKRIKASRYLECSAKMGRGVEEAFAEIANVAVASGAKSRRLGDGSCTIA